MSNTDLRTARESRGWTQQEAAARLGVSQAYLSMLERGRRSLAPLAKKLMHLYSLDPTVLPVNEVRESVSPEFLAVELARLGYPGFAHLRRGVRSINPAEFLLMALAQRDLEARIAEGLPWVVLRYPNLPRTLLVEKARAKNLQNRLGFVVTLARRAANWDELRPLEETLVESKLEREDSFCRELNDAERRWLREHRSEEARQWNLLSDLRPGALRYVA